MNGHFGNVWKIIFIVSGTLLVILGLVLCGYGASKVVDYNKLLNEAFDTDDDDDADEQEEQEELKSSVKVDIPAAIIAAAGLLTVLFVLLGCCGIIKVSNKKKWVMKNT